MFKYFFKITVTWLILKMARFLKINFVVLTYASYFSALYDSEFYHWKCFENHGISLNPFSLLACSAWG